MNPTIQLSNIYIAEQAKENDRLILHVNAMQKTIADMDAHILKLDSKIESYEKAEGKEMEAYDALQEIADLTEREDGDFSCWGCDAINEMAKDIL